MKSYVSLSVWTFGQELLLLYSKRILPNLECHASPIQDDWPDRRVSTVDPSTSALHQLPIMLPLANTFRNND